MACDLAQETRTIARRAGQRADVVGRERERHGAVAGDARLRTLDACDAAHGRGQADGAAGVGTKSAVDEARGNGRARA